MKYQPRPFPGTPPPAAAASRSSTILLIEDNPPDVRSLARLLAVTLPGTFSLRQAGTLQAGLDILHAEEIDVVLLDLNLPDSEGMETLEAVRHQALDVAIVVLSGTDDDRLAGRAMELGVEDYLIKGETRGNKLVRSIRYAIQRKNTLRASQARVTAMLQSALDGIITLDGEGRIHEFNPSAEKIFGCARDHAMGQAIYDLIVPGEDRAARSAELSAFLGAREESLAGQRLEFPAQRVDGQRIIVEMGIVRDPVQQPPRFTAFLRDITERKREVEELRSKTAFFEAIVSSSSDGMLVADTAGRKILQNQRYIDLWNVPETVAASPDLERQIPWNTGRTRNPAAFIQQFVHLQRHPEESSQEEIDLVDDTVLDRRSAPVVGADGQYFGRIWTVRDITERRRTEESLRESQARYQHIAANVPGMVHQFAIRADGTYHFAFVSEGARDIYGLAPEEVMANANLVTDMVHPEDQEGLRQALAESAATLRPMRWEGRIVCPGTGEIRFLQAASRPERHANGDVVWDGVVVDITDRKRSEEDRRAKEEAERANEAKSEFLSRMSHELRTPLNAILGFSQLLELDPLDERQRESMRHILSGGRHLLKLIDEVLDIARVDSGRISMSPEPVGIDQLVRETLLLIGPLALEGNIGLHFPHSAAPAEPAPHVLADRHRLKQVLLNLLSNAVKYNVPGGRVQVDRETAGGRLRLRIADTGVGIVESMAPRLFTPFDRLGAETTGVEGTGLGLALAKRLMEAMGGQLGHEEPPGGARGSVFWLELPLVSSPLDALNASGAHGGAAQSLLPVEPLPPQRTLLCIEDNVSNLRLIERLLEAHPEIRLMTAGLAQLGLELAEHHRPDLILLDVHLPDLEGTEVLVRLRAKESTRDIPVVVISADATRRLEERLKQTGVRAFLTKPLDIQQFYKVIRETLLENGPAR